MRSPKSESKDSRRNAESRRSITISPTSWTVLLIIGPLFLAFAFALIHYLLFRTLSNTPVDLIPLQQSLITTLSLILASAFRLSLVGSIGLSFAQHLWRVLRQEALPLYRIEQLFTVRSKALVLTNVGVLWTAPLLFSMAVYLWLLEVAVVYPPGALTVVTQSYASTENVTMAVLNKAVPDDLDPFADNSAEVYALATELTPFLNPEGVFYQYSRPLRSLSSLSRSVMSSGRIVDLPAPRGENSSYHLEFRAPQLVCTESVRNTTNVTAADPRPIDTTVFSTTWNNNDSFTLSQERFLGWFFPDSTQDTVARISEVRTLSCQPQSALYDLNISYVKGVQQSSYSIKDVQPFGLEDNGCFFVTNPPESTPASCNTNATTGSMFAVANISLATLKRTLESWNEFAPLDAMLQNMQYNYSVSNTLTSLPAGEFVLENGTAVPLLTIQELPSDAASSPARGLPLPSIPLQDSIFNTLRFNTTSTTPSSLAGQDTSTIPHNGDSTSFDPRTQLAITTPALNALLSNLSISMLSLDLWHEELSVTSTQARATYVFGNQVAFWLPYGLSLGIAVAYVALGMRALMGNGGPVVDGGFLQVMVSTRGRTGLEGAVRADMDCADRGGMGMGTGSCGLSEETLKMRVRYGEVVGVRDVDMYMGMDVDGKRMGKDSGRLVAFGTVDETESLTVRRGGSRGGDAQA
ncbi:hypothetical protein K491DRAFT_780657 [Lophiostoma macrostomum CBS 122681]|uniref:Uncharacterized protein n=1 Tax=Lophiostoma macrostomum CBS 122681 TaxID=1314788 RepID=A0A6A6T0W8_9PLEO|nr:hypothetical protein K491DRAFT_780657 [Lophiostoma macrostomum CBS 122681]